MKSSNRRTLLPLGGGFLASVLVIIPCAAMGLPTVQTLGTYDALIDALTSGKTVSTLLDLTQCKHDGSDVPGPNIRGGMQISQFIIPNGQYVGFSDTHQTLNTKDRPITEYIRYRAMPNGTVTVRFATRAEASNEITLRGKYHCTFNQGIRFLERAQN